MLRLFHHRQVIRSPQLSLGGYSCAPLSLTRVLAKQTGQLAAKVFQSGSQYLVRLRSPPHFNPHLGNSWNPLARNDCLGGCRVILPCTQWVACLHARHHCMLGLRFRLCRYQGLGVQCAPWMGRILTSLSLRGRGGGLLLSRGGDSGEGKARFSGWKALGEFNAGNMAHTRLLSKVLLWVPYIPFGSWGRRQT